MDTGTQTAKGTAKFPQDFASREDRLFPDLYRIKERTIHIELCKRWLPTYLHGIFNELVKE